VEIRDERRLQEWDIAGDGEAIFGPHVGEARHEAGERALRIVPILGHEDGDIDGEGGESLASGADNDESAGDGFKR
jgi:hypothetical protein